MDNPPRPRTGRLRTIRSLLTIMLVIDVLFLVNAALIRVSGGIVAEFRLPVELVYGPQPYVLQQVNRHLVPMSVDVYVQDPSLLQTLLGLLTHGLAHAVATLPMIVLARRLVDRARTTDPFTMPMVHGLRRLGRIVLLGGFLAELVRSAAAVALYSSAVPGGPAVLDTLLDTDRKIDLWWVLLGLVVLGFAQVVEHGCALRTELDDVI